MTTDKKHPDSKRGRSDESNNGSAESTAGTETALKGGSEPAQRQAERDWQESSKEDGE
jgi:hypothetical protein